MELEAFKLSKRDQVKLEQVKMIFNKVTFSRWEMKLILIKMQLLRSCSKVHQGCSIKEEQYLMLMLDLKASDKISMIRLRILIPIICLYPRMSHCKCNHSNHLWRQIPRKEHRRTWISSSKRWTLRIQTPSPKMKSKISNRCKRWKIAWMLSRLLKIEVLKILFARFWLTGT